MKFKRRINLVLKDNQSVVVSRGEFWRYSIFSGDGDGDFGVSANGGTSGKGIYTRMCSVTDAKLRSAASIYITGATFTVD